MKTCQRCKVEQEPDQYTGRHNTCRSCFKIYNKEYFNNNRHRYTKTEKGKLRDKENYKQNKQSILEKAKKRYEQKKLKNTSILAQLKHYCRTVNKPKRKDFETYTSNEIWAKETEYLHFDLRLFPIFRENV
jgi:hypothetical protein